MANFHPRMKLAAPGELRRAKRVLRDFTNGILINPSGVSFHEKIIISDILISMFSTALIEGAFLRKQIIALLFPDAGLAELRKTGMQTLPLTDLKAAHKASSTENLKAGLWLAVQNKLPLLKAQRHYFLNQRGNPQRAANFITSLIKNDN